MIEQFEKVRFSYKQRRAREFFCLLAGVSGGLAIAYWGVMPALRMIMIHTKTPSDSRAILANYIPANATFAEQTDSKTILTAFDYDYGMPLAFTQGSDDLLLKDHTR